MALEAIVRKEHNVFRDGAQRIDFRCTTREGKPIDMTGFSLRWQLKTSKGGAVMLEKTSDVNGGIVLADAFGTNDEAQVSVAQDDWQMLIEGDYYHVLERTDPGSEDVLSFGSFYLNEV